MMSHHRPSAQRLILALIAGLVVGIVKPTAADRVALSVSPPIWEAVLPQGGTREFGVKVTNDGDRDLTARAKVFDLELDSSGIPVIKSPGSSPQSIAKCLDVAGGAILLHPGEERTLTCRVHVQRGMTGGMYGVVLVGALQDMPFSGKAMQLETRTGVVLLLSVAHTTLRKAELTELRISHESGHTDFLVGLRNTGNVHIRATGDMVIRDQSRKVVARLKLDVGTGTILPGGTRTLVTRWGGKPVSTAGCTAEVRISAPGMRTVYATYNLDAGTPGRSRSADSGVPE